MRIAVIGSGVSGLTAAYLLQRHHDVLLFEAQPRLGGHAHTHEATDAAGRTVALDSGFIVCNDQTYPTLMRLFDELEVATQQTEMSMSISCRGCGLEYTGARGIGGLFPRIGNLARPRYLHLLTEVPRFHRAARRLLAAPGNVDPTLAEFLSAGAFSRYFVDHFVLPLVATVWSVDATDAGQYPARALFVFLRNHGMLQVTGSPQWRTVVGGSKTYVDQAAKSLTAVRISTPVQSVDRSGTSVQVRAESETHRVDRVVIATHADEALRLLADARPAETALLGAFTYSRNTAQLHTDTSVLPTNRRAQASWNHLKFACHSDPAGMQISYDLNRLMRLDTPSRYLVTLGAAERIDPASSLATMDYEHPIYTPTSVAARRRLPELNDGVTAFAGAYHGAGFHEDGCLSGVRAAASLGVSW
jgi:predicted NAD/FAD-binding protein